MNVAFGQRLSEIVTDSAAMSEPSKTSTQSVPVAEIVYQSKLAYAERLSKAKMDIEKSFHATAMVKIQTISEVRNEILHVLTENRHNVYKQMKDTFARQYRFGLLNQGLGGISKTATTALMHNIVERCSLSEMYRNHISQLRLKLALKEESIRELQQDLANKNLQHQLPEVALQLAAVIERKSEKSGKLVSIISDLLINNFKDTKRWNDDTKSLFAIILDYGGPALLKIIKEQIGGPSLQTCYATARSEIPTPTKLEEGIFEKAASFYDHIGYKGPFILAIDATAILPSLRVKGNKVIGVSSEEDVFVHTAQDIIEVTRSKTTEKARLANAFVLTPVQKHVPSYVLAISPVVKGQDFTTVRNWFTSVLNYGGRHNLPVIGIGADGDSKFRKFFMEEFLTKPGNNRTISIPHRGFDFQSVVKDIDGVPVPTLMFPDWKHLIKKWHNQILNVRRILVLGKGFVMVEELMQLYETKKLESGLWKSDIFVRDRQNVDAALRILQPQVRKCLKEKDSERTEALRTYLKVGNNMLRAFTEENMSIKERSKFAWSAVCFVRLWKAWIEKSAYPVESSFISLQTYNDMIIAGHSLILSMKVFSEYYPDLPFHPSTFGSDSCERLFSTCRGFYRGKTNLCMLDLLQICGRIVKLEELRKRKTPEETAASWPASVDDEILSGIVEAEREVIKTMETLGMLPLLTSSNILRASENGDIIYINPGMETTLVDISFEPEENECMTADELLDLDNDILCSTAETNEQCYSHSLTDLAASSAQAAHVARGTDETIEDDDDPNNCNFFQAGTCKYADATFKPPSTTHWIGCEFPECGRWFHESCLGLKFASDSERQRYAFVCKSHDNINGLDMFSDRVTASVSDKCMQVEDEELIEGSVASKTARRSTYNAETSTEQPLPPNYVEYEGNFYHIANFLSLQQGKVYNPSTSRMARWMAVARNDFYERVEAIVNPKKTTNGLYLNDISAFWVPGIGVKCGQILCLVRKTSAKSAVPVFEWKKQSNGRDKVSACFKVLSHTKKGNGKWLLSETSEVMWSECNTHLVTFNDPLERRNCPLEVNAEALEAMLPQLEKAEEERLQKEEVFKKQETEKKKMGPPEDMTVRLLKEVLDELNITYRSSEKKADLIEKSSSCSRKFT